MTKQINCILMDLRSVAEKRLQEISHYHRNLILANSSLLQLVKLLLKGCSNYIKGLVLAAAMSKCEHPWIKVSFRLIWNFDVSPWIFQKSRKELVRLWQSRAGPTTTLMIAEKSLHRREFAHISTSCYTKMLKGN